MEKTNYFIYAVKHGNVSGFFKIYQGKNGKIYLMMGNCVTELSKKQIESDLAIDVYNLIDFSHEDYVKAYTPSP